MEEKSKFVQVYETADVFPLISFPVLINFSVTQYICLVNKTTADNPFAILEVWCSAQWLTITEQGAAEKTLSFVSKCAA